MLKKFFRCALALLMLFSSAACDIQQNTGVSDGNTQNPAAPDNLTIAIAKDENSLSPFTYISSTGTVVNRLIYDTLFTTDLDDNIIPWMVEDDYQVSDDYRSYTFTLIEGQKFHDGKPLTTADIEFSFTYPASQNVASQRRICGGIESFEIADDRTMTINLVKADINFLRSGLSTMRIISKAQYEGIADATIIPETIGSGMYRLAEYKTGAYYVLEAVDDYFKGAPKVTAINMPIITDRTAVQAMLLSGGLAAATSDIGIETLDTFQSAEGIEVFANQGYAPMLMNINNEIAPLNNPSFRTALTYAVDVDGIMQTLYGEYATVGAKGVIRPDMPCAVAGLEYTYDIKKANEILDAAGFNLRNESGIRLDQDGNACSFEILAYTGSTHRIRAAELASGQLMEAGIELTVKVMEMDTVDSFVWPDFDVSNGRDYDFAMWGWNTSVNPEFLALMFSGNHALGTQNVCGYVNEDVDRLIAEKYQHATSESELYEALAGIQKSIAENPGLICFGYADTLQACNTSLYTGFKSGKGANVVNIFSFLDI